MQMPALKLSMLGVTIVALAACSQQTLAPYTKFEGMPPDVPSTTDEVQAASTGNAGKGSETPTGVGTTPPIILARPPAPAPGGGILARLKAITATLDAPAAAARATQPDWPTPLGQN
jgi:hypothetical protein